MSAAMELPRRLPNEKSQIAAAKYELDGIAEDGSSDVLPTPLASGYTRRDQQDMQRMGKDQELMVSA
jgi:hypothetical protein